MRHPHSHPTIPAAPMLFFRAHSQANHVANTGQPYAPSRGPRLSQEIVSFAAVDTSPFPLPPSPPPPRTSCAQRTPTRHLVLAGCIPTPPDCRRRVLQIRAFPACGANLLAAPSRPPPPQGCGCCPEFGPNTASLSTNSPRRQHYCAWCHPVVVTATDTHMVKPSSPQPARALSLELCSPCVAQ